MKPDTHLYFCLCLYLWPIMIQSEAGSESHPKYADGTVAPAEGSRNGNVSPSWPPSLQALCLKSRTQRLSYHQCTQKPSPSNSQQSGLCAGLDLLPYPWAYSEDIRKLRKRGKNCDFPLSREMNLGMKWRRSWKESKEKKTRRLKGASSTQAKVGRQKLTKNKIKKTKDDHFDWEIRRDIKCLPLNTSSLSQCVIILYASLLVHPGAKTLLISSLNHPDALN